MHRGFSHTPTGKPKAKRTRVKKSERPKVIKTVGADTKGSPKDDRQSQVVGGKEYVTNIVTSLTGKDKDFYGKEASKAADDYLVKTGKVKVGNYFRQVGGNFIRISKEEGEKLYKAGDPSISRSTIGSKKTDAMKYGMGGGAMGSGDPTGIMSSTPISAKMHERQKTIQAIALGAMSFAFPQTGVGALGGFGLRATAADALKNRGQKGYDEYMKKFEKKQATVMGSKRATLTGGKTFMTEEY